MNRPVNLSVVEHPVALDVIDRSVALDVIEQVITLNVEMGGGDTVATQTWGQLRYGHFTWDNLKSRSWGSLSA